MASMRTTDHEVALTTLQAQVLGWVTSGDVLRDVDFTYRAVGHREDIDDIVYQLDGLGLVELLDDGRVRSTPAGVGCWSRRHRTD